MNSQLAVPVATEPSEGKQRTSVLQKSKERILEEPLPRAVAEKQSRDSRGETESCKNLTMISMAEAQTQPICDVVSNQETLGEEGNGKGDQEPRHDVPMEGGGLQDLKASSLEQLLKSLAKEVRNGFIVSQANQKEIQGVCEGLAEKLDVLSQRTRALEVSIEELKEVTSRERQEVDRLKAKYKESLDKFESLENNTRRNIIRLMNVLEEKEEEDIKVLAVELLIHSGAWEGSEDFSQRNSKSTSESVPEAG
ncbi:hypothetical protein NDU88_001853 [Pleurodeles waltl]|uniref:Uncharacterized protein n=1 Tax=Pleurodeles waltl TaxID=8319 RepID=A0AAV7SC11_PLEWA|nr:hypothetical protein NDU88_001853 [Pleurodeles waltl]